MATTQHVTAEDLWLMPDDDRRYELIDGVLVPMSPGNWGHGELVVEFAAEIRAFSRPRRLGKVAAGDPGIIIRRDPDTVLAPDVAFIRTDRLPSIAQRERFVDVIPDLVVEVVSPSDSRSQLEEKVRRYLEAGVRIVWLAYPRHRRVVAHALGRAPHEYGIGDILDGGDVLPGFRLALAELFSE